MLNYESIIEFSGSKPNFRIQEFRGAFVKLLSTFDFQVDNWSLVRQSAKRRFPPLEELPNPKGHWSLN
jgi:hypothetical protein